MEKHTQGTGNHLHHEQLHIVALARAGAPVSSLHIASSHKHEPHEKHPITARKAPTTAMSTGVSSDSLELASRGPGTHATSDHHIKISASRTGAETEQKGVQYLRWGVPC